MLGSSVRLLVYNYYIGVSFGELRQLDKYWRGTHGRYSTGIDHYQASSIVTIIPAFLLT